MPDAEPNVEALDATLVTGHASVYTVLFKATRPIRVGEEVLYNYEATKKVRFSFGTAVGGLTCVRIRRAIGVPAR